MARPDDAKLGGGPRRGKELCVARGMSAGDVCGYVIIRASAARDEPCNVTCSIRIAVLTMPETACSRRKSMVLNRSPRSIICLLTTLWSKKLLPFFSSL